MRTLVITPTYVEAENIDEFLRRTRASLPSADILVVDDNSPDGTADIAILSSVWNDWDEPNDARNFGSNRPNEILKRDFCLVDSFGRGGVYELYRRCNK